MDNEQHPPKENPPKEDIVILRNILASLAAMNDKLAKLVTGLTPNKE